MQTRNRTAKVFVLLIASMTIGAAALMALDDQPLSAGAFCLASYTNLNPIEQAAGNIHTANIRSWDCIEIFYSNTKSGNIDYIAAINGLASNEDVNFHFTVCNGSGETDGQIQTTRKWQSQRPALPGGNWYGSSQTIRICVINKGTN